MIGNSMLMPVHLLNIFVLYKLLKKIKEFIIVTDSVAFSLNYTLNS